MSQTKAQLISDLVQALNFTGTATAPANGLFLSAANTLKLATASTERLKIDGTEVVFNETGASVDFRVEGDTEANLLLVDASTDRVGIGTNAPAAALHIQKSGTTQNLLTVESDLGSNNNRTLIIGSPTSDSGDAPFRFTTGNSLSFVIDSTSALDIDSSGKIGIGTASPSAKLHIEDSSAVQARLKSTGGDSHIYVEAPNGSSAKLELFEAGTGGFSLRVGNDNALMFFDDSAERMRIDSSGRLLIGTSTSLPAFGAGSSLQVAGTGFASGSMLIRRDSDNAFSGALVFGKSRGSLGGNTVVQSGDQVGSIIWTAADGTDLTTDLAQIKAKVDGTPGSNDMPGRIEFHTTADGASGVIERMRIDSSGQVGIGTTSPNEKLVVNGNSSVTGALFITSNTSTPSAGAFLYRPASNTLALGSNSTERLRIDSTGNVMMGTTTASGALTVVSIKNAESGISNAQNYHLHLRNNENDNGEAIGISFGITSSSTGVGASILHERDSSGSQGSLQFYTNGDGSNVAERLRITSGGNVVVGGTSLGAAGSFGMEPNGHVRTVLASGTTGDTLLGAINGVSNGFQINISGTNSQLYRFHNGSTVTAQIDSDGLKFKNDTAAANALDDYEEGTWNPDPDDGNNVFTHGQEEGRYIKIGNIVHCTFRINVTLSGTSGFAMFMTGLPFTVKDFSEETNEGISTAKGTGQQAQLEAQQGQTKFKYRNPTSGAAMSVNDVGCTNNTVKSLRGAITYITT